MKEDIKKLHIKLKAALFIIFIIVFSGFFMFSLVYLKEAALALQNYNKIPPGQVTINEWNGLDADFLWEEGDTWIGPNPLNMGNNRITNITVNSANNTDAASVQYVLNEIAAAPLAGSGDIFTIWGSRTCPGGTTQLYSGAAFSTSHEYVSGGSNPVCLEGGNPGPFCPVGGTDCILGLVTREAETLPTNLVDPGSSITEYRFIRCAKCHKPIGSCYVAYGAWGCNSGAGGFSPAYEGYLLGSTSGVPGGFSGSSNSTHRKCVTRSGFDAGHEYGLIDGTNTPDPNEVKGARWYGTRISDNFGMGGFPLNNFIKCSVCCN